LNHPKLTNNFAVRRSKKIAQLRNELNRTRE
jgi:hypothetical protein